MDLAHRHGRWIGVTLVAAVVAVSWQARAEQGDTLEEPVPVTIQKIEGEDRTTLRGQVIAWTDAGFTLRKAEDEVIELRWEQLPARHVAAVHARLPGVRDDAAEQLDLARRLSGLDDDHADPLIRQALGRAVQLDESVREQAEQILEGRTEDRTEPPAAPAMRDRPEPADDEERLAEDTPPDELIWPDVEPEEHERVVEELTEFAEETALELNLALQLYESEYFLFCTDLSADEAEHWYGLLDRMYDTLLNEFNLPEGENIWRGKALVFVFEEANDYQRFQRQMHETDPGGSLGMAHNFANGNVHIAFYRPRNDNEFAHVLVHEATHGFVHRYRSRGRIVSWINEGLAEWIAHTLVPHTDKTRNMVIRTREQLRLRQSVGGMFDARHIEPWQYGVAYTLTDFMIEHNQDGYVAFFRAIKDGVPWRQALQEQYGATLDQLLHAYGQSMGVDDLRP